MTDVLNVSISRRGFLVAGVAVGSMVISAGIPAVLDERSKSDQAIQDLNVFVAIDPSGQIIVQTPFVEMGQGIHTAIPMLIAEELDVALTQILVKEAPLRPEYRMHWNGTVRYTGSSLSVSASFMPLRRAGAAARLMLLESASNRWQVPIDTLRTENGTVFHDPSGKRLSYGQLATDAAKLPATAQVKLKERSQFKLLGTGADRIDMTDKANGSAMFGIDISLPGMLVAAVRQSPVFGGKVKSLKKQAALEKPGVVAVEIIPNGKNALKDYVFAKPGVDPVETLGTVAVVAENFWLAKSTLEKIEIEYEGGDAEGFSGSEFATRLSQRVDEDGVPAESIGNVKGALASSAKRIKAVYEVPYLAHAAMEPMNCTALYENGKCTLWTGSQNAEWVAMVAARMLKIPIADVTVVTPYLGGSFGRRSSIDFVVQAVALAQRLPGRPVKLLWTREEDFQHDFYRPRLVTGFEAGFDDQDKPVAFRQVNIGDGATRQQGLMFGAPVDASMMDSATEQPYDIPNKRTDYLFEPAAAPLGFWRSVGGSHNGYLIESFIDEMAYATQSDPVQFRRSLLSSQPRYMAALDLVVKMAGWRPKPWEADDGSRRAHGVALHKDHGTIVAQIAEVSLDNRGTPIVHNVWCTVDCGFVINPAIATSQVESAIAYGLSAALMEKVEIEDGRAQVSNFDNYPVLTAQQMPEIHVQFIDSEAEPTGLGEPATPPIPAALCNALYVLTKQRIRSLPVGQIHA